MVGEVTGMAGPLPLSPPGATWAVTGTPRAVTAIRVDGSVSGCSWFPSGTDLCIAGWQGLYRFSLQPAPRLI